ncbi:MAG: hypothetical protein AAFS01_15500, partial [Pseudomonadota bacterium]
RSIGQSNAEFGKARGDGHGLILSGGLGLAQTLDASHHREKGQSTGFANVLRSDIGLSRLA